MKKFSLILSMSLFSTLLVLPSVSQAGFMDKLQNIQNAVGSINSTTDQVQGTKNRINGFLGKFGSNSQESQSTQVVSGKIIYPKINNVNLYQSPNKSGAVINKLSKGTEMVYSGTTNNGFYMVTTEFGEGWVESTLVQ